MIESVAALYALAALAAWLAPARRRVLAASVVGSLGSALALIVGARVAWGAHDVTLASSTLLPAGGLSLHLDPLGAVFVVIAASVSLASFALAPGYAHGAFASRPATVLHVVFVASLVIVPMAANVATFVFAWELMALSSGLLILTDHATSAAARHAALWYAVITQVGALALVAGLMILAAPGGGAFVELARASGHLSAPLRATAFLALVVGFAAKAGAVPLHVWLPKAHPAAPSPISALMSGSMTALGVYGLLRLATFLPHAPAWWWTLVVALGGVSAVYGSLHASTNTDLKRVLAYSTIDVMGLALVGAGAAGALAASGRGTAAGVAVVATLMLLVVHAGFKSALFLATGEVERLFGTRDLEGLGGLHASAPFLAVVITVASFGAMALPALGGFASEWLLVQSLLGGMAHTPAIVAVAMIGGLSAVALSGGVTLLAFAKVIGIGLGGPVRTLPSPQRVDAGSRAGLGWSLVAVVALGVVPGFGVRLLAAAASTLAPSGVSTGPNGAVRVMTGELAPVTVTGLLVICVAGVALWRRASTRRVARRADQWACGRDYVTPQMHYSAASFAEPLQRVFADVLRPQDDLDVTHRDESRLFEDALRYRHSVVDVVESRGYRPVIAGVIRVGERVRGLANGSVHRYLAWGFVALVVVVVVVA